MIKSREMRLAGHIAHIERLMHLEGNTSLGRPGHRWKVNVKKDVREI
jgi:hypothetical protein